MNRIFRKAVKMQNVILPQGNPFTEHTNEIVKLMTKAVMKDEVKDSILNRDQIGQESFEQFVNERINTDAKFFWDPMKKLSLKLFRNSSKLVKTKIGDKVTECAKKEICTISHHHEKQTLNRYERSNWEHEFSAVPRSLFSADGEMLLAYEKA